MGEAVRAASSAMLRLKRSYVCGWSGGLFNLPSPTVIQGREVQPLFRRKGVIFWWPQKNCR
uniref:Uncharacterized protein n=1 Tax=Arundo donax TaxID=35708 RepID=A0A0A8ZWL4_ARUDO